MALNYEPTEEKLDALTLEATEFWDEAVKKTFDQYDPYVVDTLKMNFVHGWLQGAIAETRRQITQTHNN